MRRAEKLGRRLLEFGFRLNGHYPPIRAWDPYTKRHWRAHWSATSAEGNCVPLGRLSDVEYLLAACAAGMDVESFRAAEIERHLAAQEAEAETDFGDLWVESR